MDDFGNPKLVYLDRDRGWQLPAPDPHDTIAELRAILAPLLDEPMKDSSDGEYASVCAFCGCKNAWRFVDEARTSWEDTTQHADGCPVLRKDALLGRA